MGVTILIGLFLALLGIARASAPTAAPPWDPVDAMINGATDGKLEDVARQVHARRCRTEDCRSAILLDYLMFQVSEYVTEYENAEFENLDEKRVRIASHRLDTHLLDHPEIFPRFCAFGVKLFTRLNTANLGITPARFPFVEMFLAAAHMDAHDGGHCVHDLSAVLPKTTFADEIRDGAAGACEGGAENQSHPKAICEAIRNAPLLRH